MYARLLSYSTWTTDALSQQQQVHKVQVQVQHVQIRVGVQVHYVQVQVLHLFKYNLLTQGLKQRCGQQQNGIYQ